MLGFDGDNALYCIDENQHKIFWCVILIENSKIGSFAINDEKSLEGMVPYYFGSYNDFVKWKDKNWDKEMKHWIIKGLVPIVAPLKILNLND